MLQTNSERRGGLLTDPEAQRSAGICFVHLTNRHIDWRPENNSLYQTSMYHVFDYTRRHGYSYLRVVDTSGTAYRPGSGKAYLHGVWSKAKHLQRVLAMFELVVLVDIGDVFFPDLNKPFTDMLQEWQYDSETTLVIGYTDPRVCFKVQSNNFTDYNCAPDEMHDPNIRMMNTGFMVFRNHPKVHRLLHEWYSCRDPLLRVGEPVDDLCTGFNPGNPAVPNWLTQPVWNVLIRPQFLAGELLVLSCEFVGNGPLDTYCTGKHVWHRMYDKYKPSKKGILEKELAVMFNSSERAELLADLVNNNHIRLWA